MDISETYIKMCDCPEIQGNVEVKPPCVTLRHELWEGSRTFEAILVDSKDNVFLEKGTYYRKARTATRRIWLPRQDQLQEMVGGTFSGQLHRLVEWSTTCDFKEWKHCESMEQLWLAFVMKELHGKVWDGGIWVDKN